MRDENIANRLLERMVSNGFYGLDPSAINYSLRSINIKNKINSVGNRLLRRILYSLYMRSMYTFGELAAKVLRPESNVYAKGLALIMSGLCNECGKNNILIAEIDGLLKEKKIPGVNLWAHEVNYYFPDGTLVDTSTPNGVTSAFVANGYFDLYKATGEEKYKNEFESIVEGLVEIIGYKVISANKICFMYTPKTSYCVHNVNMLFSEVIEKAIELNAMKFEKYRNLVDKALQYTLEDFDETNSFPYAGYPTGNSSVDNYHTGFVIRSLKEISERCGVDLNKKYGLELRLKKMVNFYVANFIKDGYVVRGKNGLIQSHSLAEAILIKKLFNKNFKEKQIVDMDKAIDRTIAKLYCEKDGYFFNNIKRWFIFMNYDKTEMVRWSNCWMFYALSYKAR